MESWRDLLYTFRHYLNADVSAPKNYNEQNKNFNRKIRMFSEICREDISFNEFTDIMTQLCLLPFNIFYNQHLDYNQFLLQLRGKCWTLQLFSQLAFLLMDNPIEASECSNTIHPMQYLATRCLLINGREKKLQNWDLKFLCAFLLVSLEITKPCKISEQRHNVLKIWDPRQRIRLADGSLIDDAIFAEFVLACHQYRNKAEMFLSSYRLQIFKLFSQWTRNEAIEVLNTCHLYCYSSSLDTKLISKIKNGACHPLSIVLKMLSDGYFSDLRSFNRIIGTKSIFAFDSNLLPFLKKIKKCEFPAVYQCDEQISVGGYSGGTCVRRGECLIINQLFKNKSKYRRNGSEHDELSLKRLWSELGCRKVLVKRDLNRNEIMKTLTVFNKQLQKSKPHYCVIIILSHGRKNSLTGLEEIMDIDMQGVPIKDIKEMFINGEKCPAMIGRLKLFLFQACRGTTSPVLNRLTYYNDYLIQSLNHYNYVLPLIALFGMLFMSGAVATNLPEQYAAYTIADCTNSTSISTPKDNVKEEGRTLASTKIENRVPRKSWYFVFHSTIDDNVSFRTSKGSMFIQSFCQEMRNNCYRHDLNTIATYVNRSVMEKHKVQASVFENNLGDLIYFKQSVIQSK